MIPRWSMSKVKNAFSHLYLYVLWGVLSAVIWIFVFGFVTDTSIYKKVTLFVDAQVEDTALAVELERDMPDGIEMIKVHPFSYAMFDDSNITTADMFIIPESEIDVYASAFADIEGIKVWDAKSHTGAAAQFIDYPDEDCWLFFNIDGVHLEDGAAMFVAEKLLKIK